VLFIKEINKACGTPVVCHLLIIVNPHRQLSSFSEVKKKIIQFFQSINNKIDTFYLDNLYLRKDLIDLWLVRE